MSSLCPTCPHPAHSVPERAWLIARIEQLEKQQLQNGNPNSSKTASSNTQGETKTSPTTIAANTNYPAVLGDVACTLLTGHTGHKVQTIGFSPDGKSLVSGESGEGAEGDTENLINIWDVTSATLQKQLKPNKGMAIDCPVASVLYSPSGKQLASIYRAKSGNAHTTGCVWDAASGDIVTKLKGSLYGGNMESMAFSPSGGRLAMGGSGPSFLLSVWDLYGCGEPDRKNGHKVIRQTLSKNSGKPFTWEESGGTRLTCLTYASDGKHLVSGGSDGAVRVWSFDTFTNVKTLHNPCGTAGVTSIAISPDNQWVVFGGQWSTLKPSTGTVRLWDRATENTVYTFEGHTELVTSVAFSPNGQCIVSGSHDTTVRLWDVASGATLCTLEGHTETVNAVQVSPDGVCVASASDDGSVRIWRVGATTDGLGVMRSTPMPCASMKEPFANACAQACARGEMEELEEQARKEREQGRKGQEEQEEVTTQGPSSPGPPPSEGDSSALPPPPLRYKTFRFT